jgi:hypothetical protein
VKADSNGEDAVSLVKVDAVALTSAAPENDNDGGDGTVDHEMRRDVVQGLTGERSQTVQEAQDAEEQVEQDFQAVTQNRRRPSELAVQNLAWVPFGPVPQGHDRLCVLTSNNQPHELWASRELDSRKMPRSVQRRQLVQIDLNDPPEWFLNVNTSATVERLAHAQHALDEQIANAYLPHQRVKGKSKSQSHQYGTTQRRDQKRRDLKRKNEQTLDSLPNLAFKDGRDSGNYLEVHIHDLGLRKPSKRRSKRHRGYRRQDGRYPDGQDSSSTSSMSKSARGSNSSRRSEPDDPSDGSNDRDTSTDDEEYNPPRERLRTLRSRRSHIPPRYNEPYRVQELSSLQYKDFSGHWRRGKFLGPSDPNAYVSFGMWADKWRRILDTYGTHFPIPLQRNWFWDTVNGQAY